MTMVAAYFVTSVGFSVVYLITRSLTAAMVSHSLQSLYAFGGIILFGKGDVVLSPIIYIILFGCPIIVYGVAQLLRRIY